MSEVDRRGSWDRAMSTVAKALETNISRKLQLEAVPHIDHLVSLYPEELFTMPCGYMGCFQAVFSFTDVYSESGFPRKAKDLRENMCRNALKYLPGDVFSYAQALQQLARNYSDLGDYRTALKLRQKAIDRLATSHSDSLLMLSCKLDLCDSLEDQGSHEGALAYLEGLSTQFAHRTQQREYHNELGRSSRKLAILLRRSGKVEKSLKMLEEHVVMQEKVYHEKNRPEDDHEYLKSMTELAKSHEAHGALVQSLEVFSKVLEMREQHHHKIRDILVAKEDVASILSRLNYTKEALIIRERIVRDWESERSELGNEHLDFVKARVNLGNSLADTKQYERSLDEYNQVLQVRQRLYGIDSLQTLEIRCRIATTKRENNEIEDAVNMLNAVMKGWKGQTRGRSDVCARESSKAKNELANTFRRINRFQDALSIREELHEEEKELCQEESILKTMKELVVDYLKLGRIKDSIEVGEKAVSKQKEILGHRHWLVCDTMVELSSVYREPGKYRDQYRAIDLLKESLQIQEENQWWEDSERSLDRLSRIYQQLGKKALASEARARRRALPDKRRSAESALADRMEQLEFGDK